MGLSGNDSHKKRDITIRVDETRMSISIPMDEDVELHLRSGAKMVNELLSQYRLRFPDASKEDTLAYVALHCARDFCALEHQRRHRQTDERLQALLKSIDEALK